MSDVVYVIIPVAELTEGMVNASSQRHSANLRLSIDTTLVLIKFVCTSTNEWRHIEFKNYAWYTKDEIDVIMATAAWAE